MAKLLKRIGTKKKKFEVEIEVKSLEINVSDAEKCKCQLVYHRGFFFKLFSVFIPS